MGKIVYEFKYGFHTKAKDENKFPEPEFYDEVMLRRLVMKNNEITLTGNPITHVKGIRLDEKYLIVLTEADHDSNSNTVEPTRREV